METIDQIINEIRKSALPVFFETGVKEFPYSGKGTCFAVTYKSREFLITARHVIEGNNLDQLIVYPNVNAKYPIPFKRAYAVANRDENDLDYSDIVLIEIDGVQHRKDPKSDLKMLKLNTLSESWALEPENHNYLIYGYSDSGRYIDYEEVEISGTQQAIGAEFYGESASTHSFKLKVKDSNGCEDYNGLSGSPIISWHKRTDIEWYPSFCGMVIRGTHSSGIFHFLDEYLIKHALEVAISS